MNPSFIADIKRISERKLLWDEENRIYMLNLEDKKPTINSESFCKKR